jgi:hypothetical protein
VQAIPTNRLPRLFIIQLDDGITSQLISVLIDPEETGCDPQSTPSVLECEALFP